MNSLTISRGRGRRRALVAVLAVLAMFVPLHVATAPGASALTQNDAIFLAGQVRSRALTSLRLRPRCLELIDGVRTRIFPPGTAITALERATLDASRFNINFLENGVSPTIARTDQGGAQTLFVTPRRPPTIELFQAFFDIRIAPPAFDQFAQIPFPDDMQLRTVALLHETAHLTGALAHGPGDPTPAFNTEILNRCLTPFDQFTVTSLECQETAFPDEPYIYIPEITCDATWAGGVGPFAVQWTSTQPFGERITVDQAGRQSRRVGSCGPLAQVPGPVFEFDHPIVTVSITVTDITGLQVSAMTTVKCLAVGW
jgi:hypothetical protein